MQQTDSKLKIQIQKISLNKSSIHNINLQGMRLTSTILSFTWILLHRSAALPSLMLLINIPDNSSVKQGN